MKGIYLDNASTTPVRKEVLKAMLPYFSEKFGNPMALHSLGVEAREAVEKARAAIAKTINAAPEEIIFTSGGTEANNLAIKGIAYARSGIGNHIITSPIERESVYGSCIFLASRGYQISYLPVDIDGLVSAADVRSKITPKTILVSVMHASTDIGSIEPIEDITRITQEKGVVFHTDATQSYGKVPIDVKAMRIDLMSLSAAHIYGPKGIGALYVRSGLELTPLIHGRLYGRGLRAGMLNVPAIVGFATAAELAAKEMKKESKRQSKLRDLFIRRINDDMKFVKLNGHIKRRLPGHINFSFDGITGADLIKALEKHGITASTTSNIRILESIGVKGQKLQGSARFSLGNDTTEKNVRYTMKTLQKIVEEARKKH